MSVATLLVKIITFEARSVSFAGRLFLQFNATTFEVRSAVNHVTIIHVRRKSLIMIYECLQYLAAAMEVNKTDLVHSCRGKAISISFSESVSVNFSFRHAKSMRIIILSSVSCTAVQSTIS